MKDHPILFSTPMVQAILAGRKTQTRRIITPHNSTCFTKAKSLLDFGKIYSNGNLGIKVAEKENPELLWRGQCKWQKGDTLWVRETWAHTKQLNLAADDENYGYIYKADDQPWKDYQGFSWKPSIHMPKAAARLFLNITNVMPQHLQEISEKDAIAEGIESAFWELFQENKYLDYSPALPGCFSNKKLFDAQIAGDWRDPISSFKSLWQSINGKESWFANPMVWAIDFEVK